MGVGRGTTVCRCTERERESLSFARNRYVLGRFSGRNRTCVFDQGVLFRFWNLVGLADPVSNSVSSSGVR